MRTTNPTHNPHPNPNKPLFQKVNHGRIEWSKAMNGRVGRDVRGDLAVHVAGLGAEGVPKPHTRAPTRALVVCRHAHRDGHCRHRQNG